MKKKPGVIIVEDSRLWRKTIIRELESLNLHVMGEAETGLELLALLQHKIPDVILLDLEMPEMDGNTTFSILTEKYPRIKVIILSQYDDASLIENYKQRGAYEFLSKQLVADNLSVLADCIRKAYRKKSGSILKEQVEVAGKFSDREKVIIPLICDGKTSREIGDIIGVSEKTVERDRQSIFEKSNTRNVIEFVRYGFKKGLDFLGR